MPITIKSTEIKVKGPNGYIPLDTFAEESSAEKIAAINTAATQKIAAIETKGQETLESIPNDYTELTQQVSALKSDVDEFYMKKSTNNLFTLKDRQIGKRLYRLEVGTPIQSTDATNTNIERIVVKPNTTYSFVGVFVYVEADENDISTTPSSDNLDSSTMYTITTTSQTKSLWVTTFPAFEDLTKIVEGNQDSLLLPEYISVGLKNVSRYPLINDNQFETNNEQVFSSEKVLSIHSALRNRVFNVTLANDVNSFVEDNVWINDGTNTVLSKVKSTNYIDCDEYDYIDYKLWWLYDSHGKVNFISFFDADKNYIIGYSTGGSTWGNAVVYGKLEVPTNAKYVVGTWNTSIVSDVPFIVGIKRLSIQHRIEECERRISDIALKPIVPEVVNEFMTREQFITAFNSAMTDYATLCKCATFSFETILADSQWDEIYRIVNHNIRQNVCVNGKSFKGICEDINYLLTVPVRRFMDAKCETSAVNFSLNTGFQADEPSVIVSEDGSTMHIYAHLKRISTTDGVNWSTPIVTPLSDNGYILHNGVNLIDGVYYMIGCRQNVGGDLCLYTSTDGVNFTYRGVMFHNGHVFATGYDVTAWGNPYLIKDYGNGKFYLYIETMSDGKSWVIHLATCTDIFYANSDGTIGNWQSHSRNPIIETPFHNNAREPRGSAGNMDFVKGEDNRPIRVNGYYYAYFHSTFNGTSNIARVKSVNLIDWENEGIILDNRDEPTGGYATSGNADHCIMEYKGRSYLFYTWDINNSSAQPYIKYTVDDRNIREMCALYP